MNFAITVPRDQLNNNAQSCPYLLRLKRDARCVSVTLEVVLPSASSDFQSALSEVTCTVYVARAIYLKISRIMAA